ncbi:basic proline-rich protein-like [Meles meles]|uniref:basic proline-rich protein-like n=1 Tax=Meles meles TaxID=9662 RepID=UPI001E6A0697|nr:basic proline-rich protein-like [Meles meles]
MGPRCSPARQLQNLFTFLSPEANTAPGMPPATGYLSLERRNRLGRNHKQRLRRSPWATPRPRLCPPPRRRRQERDKGQSARRGGQRRQERQPSPHRASRAATLSLGGSGGWGARPEIGPQQAPPQPRRGPQVPATAARCTLRQSTPAARRVSGRPGGVRPAAGAPPFGPGSSGARTPIVPGPVSPTRPSRSPPRGPVPRAPLRKRNAKPCRSHTQTGAGQRLRRADAYLRAGQPRPPTAGQPARSAPPREPEASRLRNVRHESAPGAWATLLGHAPGTPPPARSLPGRLRPAVAAARRARSRLSVWVGVCRREDVGAGEAPGKNSSSPSQRETVLRGRRAMSPDHVSGDRNAPGRAGSERPDAAPRAPALQDPRRADGAGRAGRGADLHLSAPHGLCPLPRRGPAEAPSRMHALPSLRACPVVLTRDPRCSPGCKQDPASPVLRLHGVLWLRTRPRASRFGEWLACAGPRPAAASPGNSSRANPGTLWGETRRAPQCVPWRSGCRPGFQDCSVRESPNPGGRGMLARRTLRGWGLSCAGGVKSPDKGRGDSLSLIFRFGSSSGIRSKFLAAFRDKKKNGCALYHPFDVTVFLIFPRTKGHISLSWQTVIPRAS